MRLTLEYLTVRCASLKAGNISTAICVLSTVRGASIALDSLPMSSPVRPYVPSSPEETIIIQSEVLKLLEKGVIEKTAYGKCEVISGIFTRPKKCGSHRLVLNLKGLNQFVSFHHFKMDSLQCILKLIEKNRTSCYS